MTTSKHFKQLVRARMGATGESYSTASDRVRAVSVRIELADPVVVDVHGRHGQTVAFTPDGTRVLSGGQDARIAILDAATGSVEGELTGHDKVVNAVAIGSDAITGGYDGRIRLWNLNQQTAVQEYPSDLQRIAAVAYTPDGARFAESGQGPRVHIRDVGDGSVVAELDTEAPGVIGLAVAPDGSMLATAGYHGTVRLWDCDSWNPIRDLTVGERANAVCFSRNGQLLAAAAKGRIAIWNFEEDDPVAQADLPISGVYALAFSPDAKRLAQTGADGKVRIWTLR